MQNIQFLLEILTGGEKQKKLNGYGGKFKWNKTIKWGKVKRNKDGLLAKIRKRRKKRKDLLINNYEWIKSVRETLIKKIKKLNELNHLSN